MKKFLMAVFIVLMVTASTCYAAPSKKTDPKKPEIQKIEKGKYARVALLVSRIGGTPPSEISLKTDYAKPIVGSEKRAGSQLQYEGFYIEDDACLSRLKLKYPLMHQIKRGGLLAFLDETFYYRNITPEISSYLNKWLSEKGYQVFNVNEISASWDKPLSEMSLEDIASNCGDETDLLLVFHYTDHGNRNYDDQRSKRITKGLSVISYNLAAFDLASKERVLMFTPQVVLGVYGVMVADPEIKGDPALQAKIKTINSPKADVTFERGYWDRTRSSVLISNTQIVSLDGFTEDEIIQYAMKYITNGFTLTGLKCVGLNQVIY